LVVFRPAGRKSSSRRIEPLPVLVGLRSEILASKEFLTARAAQSTYFEIWNILNTFDAHGKPPPHPQ
jgi:hypothetical protein